MVRPLASPAMQPEPVAIGRFRGNGRKRPHPQEDEPMAKGQKKSNKEARKPKKGSAKPILAKPGTSQVTQVLRDKAAG
jgi:hypothetical protein